MKKNSSRNEVNKTYGSPGGIGVARADTTGSSIKAMKKKTTKRNKSFIKESQKLSDESSEETREKLVTEIESLLDEIRSQSVYPNSTIFEQECIEEGDEEKKRHEFVKNFYEKNPNYQLPEFQIPQFASLERGVYIYSSSTKFTQKEQRSLVKSPIRNTKNNDSDDTSSLISLTYDDQSSVLNDNDIKLNKHVTPELQKYDDSESLDDELMKSTASQGNSENEVQKERHKDNTSENSSSENSYSDKGNEQTEIKQISLAISQTYQNGIPESDANQDKSFEEKEERPEEESSSSQSNKKLEENEKIENENVDVLISDSELEEEDEVDKKEEIEQKEDDKDVLVQDNDTKFSSSSSKTDDQDEQDVSKIEVIPEDSEKDLEEEKSQNNSTSESDTTNLEEEDIIQESQEVLTMDSNKVNKTNNNNNSQISSENTTKENAEEEEDESELHDFEIVGLPPSPKPGQSSSFIDFPPDAAVDEERKEEDVIVTDAKYGENSVWLFVPATPPPKKKKQSKRADQIKLAPNSSKALIAASKTLDAPCGRDAAMKQLRRSVGSLRGAAVALLSDPEGRATTAAYVAEGGLLRLLWGDGRETVCADEIECVFAFESANGKLKKMNGSTLEGNAIAFSVRSESN